ncbi:hypothetical protein Tco_0681859 [Tanacetum coccineum]|uniref:CCHC-type domain-containing protein n=1 Tax=Tanacetum coccineum TaxID=301880 RepID=A0ABQ4XQP2_9ASTR
MWPELTRLGTMKERGMLGFSPTATSAGLLLPPNTQGAAVRNQQGIGCYEYGRPRHFRKDCPELRSQNSGNQARNKSGNKTGNQTGDNRVTVKAYAIGEG